MIAVYSDKWFPILRAMGSVEITRASEVEWEDGAWVGRLAKTGEIIATNENRAECIRAEVEYLQGQINKGELS